MLTRAIRTANLALDAAGQSFVPMIKDWRLNERHYGGLTGHTHAEEEAIHGKDQVRVWRRSYDVPPPPLEAGRRVRFHPRSAIRRGDAAQVGEPEDSPWSGCCPIGSPPSPPRIAEGETVMVAAHGNSLRAIVKHLFAVSDEAIPGWRSPPATRC